MVALPRVIQQYFQAVNQRNMSLFNTCMAADIQVQDEGETHQGIANVQAWQQASIARYQHRCHGISWRQQQTLWYVDTVVTGEFSASPLTLTIVFTLAQQLITQMEFR